MASIDLARTGDEEEIRYTPVVLALVVAAGLLLRLVLLSAALPTGAYPLVLDEGNYVGLAVPLTQGQGFVDKWVWIRPPAYPVYLALTLLLSDGSLILAQWLQVLLSVANIPLIYALAVDIFTLRSTTPRRLAEAAGLAAAALFALNPHIILYANHLMPETLYMLALTVMTWALVRALHIWRRHGSPAFSRSALAWVAVAGLAAGIGSLLRALVLSFVPILLVWFWWLMPRKLKEPVPGGPRWLSGIASRWSWRSLVPLALFLVVTFAPILPWTVYNYARWHRFLLVDTTGGWNLLQYNVNIGTKELAAQLMEIPNPVDRGNYATRWGVQALLDDPGLLATEGLQRVADAWPVDQFGELRLAIRNKYPGIDCTYQDIYAWLETIFYVGLGLLAIWGVALAPGRGFKVLFILFAAHYALITWVAHAEFRYHMPLYPYASVFAGWALVSLVQRARGLRWPRRRSKDRVPSTEYRVNDRPALGTRHPALGTRWALAIAGILSLLFLVGCGFKALPGMIKSISYERRYLTARSQFDSGDYAAALANFQGAATLDGGCACLYRYIGLAEGKLGQQNEEIASYRTALDREEFDWRTSALLSDRLRAAGNPQAAAPVLHTRPEYRTAQLKWAWDNLSPPPLTGVDLGGTDIGYVSDFEAAESEQAAGSTVTYRWSTAHSYVRLAVPQGTGKLQVAVRWHSLGWPQPDAKVQLAINGRAVSDLTAHPGWEEARLTLPDSALTAIAGSGDIVVEFLTTANKPPGGETRHLGVAVDDVRLEREK